LSERITRWCEDAGDIRSRDGKDGAATRGDPEVIEFINGQLTVE